MTTPTEKTPRRTRFDQPAVVCVALAALVFASRAWLLAAWGSPVPFWDQWDADGALFHSWLAGTLHWRDLFAAHNEHRIALTRIADLALFAADGRWNPWAQLLLNGVLHAATAAALAALFWPALTPRARTGFVAGLAVLFTATCGWQNALWGFQSQVYFASLLAVATVAGIVTGAPFSSTWWLGWLAAVLALFANGGGLLGAVVALGAGTVAALLAPARRAGWCAVLALAAVAALGLALRVAPAYHEPLRAQSLAQFWSVFTRCLSWPYVNCGWPWLFTQLPLVWLAVHRWRRRIFPDALERCAIALGLLAVLHAAAVAYSRGAGLPEFRPLSRYQDPLLPGVAAQMFAALRLAGSLGRPGRMALLGWLATIAAGLLTLTETNFTLHLPYKRAQDRTNLALVRTYLATHDAAVFARDPYFHGLHPDPVVVQRVLDDPLLHPVLPATFFAPADAPDASQPWLVRHGRAFTSVAALALAATLVFSLRQRSDRPHPAMAPQPGTH